MDHSFTLTWSMTTAFYEAAVEATKLGKKLGGGRASPAPPLATALPGPSPCYGPPRPFPLLRPSPAPPLATALMLLR